MIINWKEKIYDDSSGYNFYNGGWVKSLASIDSNKSNGYAFVGDFVQNSTSGLTECANGLYLVCSVEGSRKNQTKQAAIYRITGDNAERVTDWVSGNDWALKLRGKAIELLAEKAPENNPLENYTTEQLLAELKRRESSPTPGQC